MSASGSSITAPPPKASLRCWSARVKARSSSAAIRRLPTMTVLIPTPLQSYTGPQREVQAEGATPAELLFMLNRTYPGVRFRIVTEPDRIRPHINIFVNDIQARVPLATTDRVQILCALSGG